MNPPLWLRPVLDALGGERRKPTIILLVCPFLMVTWKYFGSPEFYRGRLASWFVFFGDPETTAAVYSFLACLALLGVAPALVVKFVLRERLADYGVGLGDRVRTARTFVLLAPLFVLAAYVGSRDPAVLAEYPINKHAGNSPGMFALHALTYLGFYAGWEFCFRGFMQFGLRRSLGDANALLTQVLASCLLHLGKPAAEVYGSIFAAVLWGLVAFRTRSLLSGMMQHFVLGVAVDGFICYGSGGRA